MNATQTAQEPLTGQWKKEQGQTLVESHNQDFMDAARSYAVHFAALKGAVTTDDIHEWLDALGLSPRHPNAFGAIFRGPQWKSCGFVKSKRASAHARFIQKWALV